jgi:hypothetical protein
MSHSVGFLHSHSSIERDMRLPKHYVIIDEEYKNMFLDAQLVKIGRKKYYKVGTLDFVLKGGIFKNFSD